MSLRILGRTEVLAAGGDDIAAAMQDIRMSLAMLRAGEAEMPPETSVRLGAAGETQARVYALAARVGDRAGVKWTAHRPPGSQPASFTATLVSDAITGEPLGLVESVLLTMTRTAATSAFMLLARPPRHVTVLGAGRQAAAHLRMLVSLFPSLQQVRLWNRTPEGAVQLVAATDAPWPLLPTASLDEALAEADAVLACTSAATPFIGPEVMRPGRTLLQIGYDEVCFDAIDRADAIVVDLWGEFRLTSAKSLFRMHRAGRFGPERVDADLSALALDAWRPTPEASVYFSSFGLNLFDIALAARVLRAAEPLALGHVRCLGL